jgi:chromosomal replication initiation ATPase DnaA
LAEPAFRIEHEVSEECATRASGSALIETDALLRKEENALELCESMIDIAAALFNVPSKDIRLPRRTPLSVSRVRQVAMYVAHVVLGLSMGEVGRGFGRDRKTVQHACHVIEDMRDDPDFDHIVAQTERVAAIALRNRIPR